MPFLDAGFNHLMDVYLGGVTRSNTWHVGLISATSFSTITPQDTLAAHSGWSEFTGYNPTTRAPILQWDSSLLVTGNPNQDAGLWEIETAPANYQGMIVDTNNIISTLVYPTVGHLIKGMFITDIATKLGTGGTLLWAGEFATGEHFIAPGDVLELRYRMQVESWQY